MDAYNDNNTQAYPANGDCTVPTAWAVNRYAKPCAACHGSRGEISALQKADPIAQIPYETVYDLLRQYRAGTLNQNGYGALMKGQVANMNDNELEQMACLISKLPGDEK
jgi:cytochrome c553